MKVKTYDQSGDCDDFNRRKDEFALAVNTWFKCSADASRQTSRRLTSPKQIDDNDNHQAHGDPYRRIHFIFLRDQMTQLSMWSTTRNINMSAHRFPIRHQNRSGNELRGENDGPVVPIIPPHCEREGRIHEPLSKFDMPSSNGQIGDHFAQ